MLLLWLLLWTSACRGIGHRDDKIWCVLLVGNERWMELGLLYLFSRESLRALSLLSRVHKKWRSSCAHDDTGTTKKKKPRWIGSAERMMARLLIARRLLLLWSGKWLVALGSSPELLATMLGLQVLDGSALIFSGVHW